VPVESVTPEACDPPLSQSIGLLVDFVSSTASLGGRREELGGADDLAAWSASRGLGDAEVPTEGDAFTAREFRDALISVFRAHCDCPTAPVGAAESYLRQAARRYPVVATIGAEGCWFEAAQPGVPGVFGSLLAAAAHVTSQGLWPRLKVCKNSTCYAGFYDKTRNLSGQFCGPACNSQASMRAYRQRRKGA
jgi:predicted RNA-binding Zn ribbon-like protein